jgi:hypothetical protein
VVHFYFEDCVYYTPMNSDVEGGDLRVRLPMDLRTGGWRWPRRDGRPVRPTGGAAASALAKILLRRPIVTRAA